MRDSHLKVNTVVKTDEISEKFNKTWIKHDPPFGLQIKTKQKHESNWLKCVLV